MNLNLSLFGIYHPTHKLTLLLCDIVAVALSFYLATNFRIQASPNYASLEFIGLNLIILSSLFIGGAYTSSGIGSAPKLPLKTFFTVLASSFPCMLFIYLLGPERFTALFGRGVFPVAIVSIGILTVVTRHLINNAFHDQNSTRKVLLLGNANAKERISKSLQLGRLPIEIEHAERVVPSRLAANPVNAIVIAPDHSPDNEEQQFLIDYRLAGVPIFSLSNFFESFLFLVPVQEINNDWFIRAEGFTMLHSSVTTRIKRVVDILLALLLFVVTSPIFLLCAVMIKVSSRGPVFFSQTRVGVKGKPFTLYKFRTMKIDAEQDGAQWASDDDPRILPIGRFLRKSRIDELPQCWNILKGDMSIIGPRPERPEFTSMLSHKIPYYDLRHVIKPGLTGWAQVMYPYGASTDDALKKLQFDLYYIKNYSLLLDLNILLRTVLITLHHKGR